MPTEKDRAKNAAVAAGGAGVLGGTASLPRVEGAVQDKRKARYDRKINNLKAQMGTKGTPVGDRQNINGQYVGRGAEYKRAKKARIKGLQGQISDLQAKKNAVKRPRLAGNAKATWAGIGVGAPMLWHGTRQQFEKADSGWKRRDVDAGIVGAGVGAGAYQESSYALKPLDRRAERKISQDPVLNRKQKVYQNANRPKGAKAGDRAWRPYFRNYPKDLPGGRLKRTLAVTHTGKTGGAFTVAAGGAGALGAASLSRKHRESKKVEKSMSLSAFGVDHGEISKAMPKIPGAIKNPMSAGKPQVNRLAGGARKTGNAFASGAAGIRQGAGATTGAQGAAFRAGAGTRRLGQGIQGNLRPLGAGALAGGGAAGGASMFNNRRKQGA